jgi:hypothetical protein
VVVPVQIQLMQLMVLVVLPVAWLLSWRALVMPRTRSVDTTRVLVVLVPVLEPVLPVAWLLSLVVVPVVPMQQMVLMVLVVLPVAWLLSWRALAFENITTRTPTPMRCRRRVEQDDTGDAMANTKKKKINSIRSIRNLFTLSWRSVDSRLG